MTDAHQHEHDHEHEHDRDHGSSLLDALLHLLGLHSHSHHEAALDPALATERGLWAVKVSLVGLLVTALFQLAVVASSGSVALLADTIHNFSDALTSIPLWLAFTLARRSRNRQYTYGFGRAEDLAGAVIVGMIFFSALEVFYQSFEKIIHPQPLSNLAWVAVAAVVGFLGNELVGTFRIRVGRQIGSAALCADGVHSRIDGFASLSVLLGVVGVWLGFPLADPLIGFAMGVVILIIVRDAAREIWRRLMDATDPQVCDIVEKTVRAVPGVLDTHSMGVRWLGHWQHLELHITVDGDLPTRASHQIAEDARHALFHTLPNLQEITVHIDPLEREPGCEHAQTAHHAMQ